MHDFVLGVILAIISLLKLISLFLLKSCFIFLKILYNSIMILLPWKGKLNIQLEFQHQHSRKIWQFWNILELKLIKQNWVKVGTAALFLWIQKIMKNRSFAVQLFHRKKWNFWNYIQSNRRWRDMRDNVSPLKRAIGIWD